VLTSIPDLLARRASLSSEAVALEDAVTGRTLTYAELDRRAALVAGLMRARGVAAGDRVGILCRNRIAFFEILFACARLGAILVPLNWRMPPAELQPLIDDCAPVLLFHGEEEGSTVAGLDRAPPVIDLDRDYGPAAAAAMPAPPCPQWPRDGIWYLLYTSGTTGRPKGVIYTFGMALANYVNIGAAIDIRSADATANFLPLFHTAGINLHTLPTLIQGGRVIVLPGFDADRMVALIEAERLDTVFAVPTVYQALLDHSRFAAAPLARVRHWGCGGAPLPDILVERSRSAGIRICAGMGMTETGPTAFLASPEDAWERIGSVGRPQLLVGARIVDDRGREVTPGQVGDLLFSGPAVTPGYWNDADATRAAFTADGWLRTGDLARQDPDGFWYIAGRRKDMFISGGENVYPAEIENVLAGHPAVSEAAVVGAPHPKWGEVGRAFIQLADGRPRPGEPELEAFCRTRLAAYKVPQSFEFVPDLPRTAAGKVQKHLLTQG
jgi:fatty-acyl-CoA synthase